MLDSLINNLLYIVEPRLYTDFIEVLPNKGANYIYNNDDTVTYLGSTNEITIRVGTILLDKNKTRVITKTLQMRYGRVLCTVVNLFEGVITEKYEEPLYKSENDYMSKTTTGALKR